MVPLGLLCSPLLLLSAAEEEYKRLSECLADEGTYNAVAFKYTADYYDPSQPTEEEEGAKEPGQTLLERSFPEAERLSADLCSRVLLFAEEAEPELSEEPFVAPPGLAIPADVELVSGSWKLSSRCLLFSALQSPSSSPSVLTGPAHMMCG